MAEVLLQLTPIDRGTVSPTSSYIKSLSFQPINQEIIFGVDLVLGNEVVTWEFRGDTQKTRDISSNTIGFRITKEGGTENRIIAHIQLVAPYLPFSPYPTNNATGTELSPLLQWKNGDGSGYIQNTHYYNIYWGTTPDHLLERKGIVYKSQSDPLESSIRMVNYPSELNKNQIYYWRVDAVNVDNVVTTGTVWRFTTGSGSTVLSAPVTPSPSNGATSVNINDTTKILNLNWVDGSDNNTADHFKVYFDTINPPTDVLVDNLVSTNIDTGILSYDTTYYWRVKAYKGSAQSVNGNVWSFTTESAATTILPTSTFTHCLTTTTYDVGGVIMQQHCSLPDGAWEGKSKNESCTFNGVSAGDVIELRASADSGYTIGDWNYNVSTNPFVLSNGTSVPANFYDGEAVAYVKMPNGDVTISVGFNGDITQLSYSVAGGFGSLLTPGHPTVEYGDTPVSFNTSSTSVRFSSVANSGWDVLRWVVNGITTTASGINNGNEYLDVLTQGGSNFDVEIFFEELNEEECTKNTLTVFIEGEGSVSSPSGDYCDYEEFILNPIPSNGYCFKEWVYGDVTITLNGISLEFDMSKNRTVTAVFERIGGYVEEDFSLFYCPSSVSRTNTVDFDYTNSGAEGDFHFVVTFYSDADKTETLFSASSLLDNKRWFYNDGSFKQIPTNGVTIETSEEMDIVYSPEVLSSRLSETKREEFYLVCGVRYYIDIEAHRGSSDIISLVKSISLIVDCDDVDSFYRSNNNDKNNWICSGQGNSDLLVTGDIGQSLFPAIDSNIFGIFNIVWQSRRNNISTVYAAMWDSDNDLLYSSGQGLNDTKIFDSGFSPIIIEDPVGSFYVSSYINTKLRYYVCPIKTFSTCTTYLEAGELTERLCYPGQSTRLSSTIDDIIVRVYEEDTDDNIVINKDKVIPITTKTNIRLDISGTNALYAVRLRDSNDSEWSDWINIDTALYKTEGMDITLNAYKISDSRIIVPWTLDKINGVRRICCQLLTLYGISPTVCIDIFMNVNIIQYIFKFYKDEGMVDGSEVPSYNGLPVVSQVRDISTGEVVGNVTGTTDTVIYFKVLFSEDIITSDGLYNGVPYIEGDFTFNLVQQGIDDIWGGVLEKEDNRTFKGSFNIYEQDGVFNRDGNAFIQVLAPNSLGSSFCISDISDPYNLMQNSNDAGRYHDLVPEEIFNQYKTSQIGKALNTTDFKQYYRIDDDNFRFGNPDFFRNDKQG